MRMTEDRDAAQTPAQMAADLLYPKLERLLRDLGIKQSALAKATGIREAAISDGVTKQTGLDVHWVTITDYLASKHRINPNWFLRNQGPMYLAEVDTQQPGSASGQHPALREPSGNHPTGGFAAIREVGVVNAQNKFVPFEGGKSRRCTARECAQVQTDDMSPVIRPGQWVLLADPERTPHDGEIVLVTTKQFTWVRRYRTVFDVDAVLMEAVNHDPHVRTVYVKREEIETVRVVLGVVFE
jgi:hypothetical protein